MMYVDFSLLEVTQFAIVLLIILLYTPLTGFVMHLVILVAHLAVLKLVLPQALVK